ncbi:protocadherin gamma-B7-like isoform X2 [Hypanus sabinus]|uniref:protocadherin gamma-B7-like isoform X2 n=1 Tax=Hypanus sabinus TaxID=79690 RepID=UPI0028C4C799|nr:protocadherin gamma-B7-like isoform X2 [Hypanus sabinus]
MADLVKWLRMQWRFTLLSSIVTLDTVCGEINYSIPEELEPGSVVGNISKDLGLDIRQLMARKLHIVSRRKKQYLDIDLNAGTLFTKVKVDREQLCEQNHACTLNLEAVLQEPLQIYSVEIEILDINDNVPVFQKNEYCLDVSEKASAGTRFPLQSAQDLDVGTNSIRSYQLTPNEHFALISQLDNNQSGILELVLQRPLDREQRQTYELTVTAADGGEPQKFGTSKIIIRVIDVNDNAPACEQNVYRISIPENIPKNTLIGKVTAMDADEGLNGEVIYSYSDRTSERIRRLFSLDAKSGEIRATGTVDFEETNKYTILVQAMDRGLHAMPVTCQVVLQVTDVNDNSPDIMITSSSRSIPEDAPPGTLVAVLRVTDADSGEAGDVNCHIADNIPFVLDSSFKHYYTLLSARLVDREKVSEYNITITCSDAGIPPHTMKETIRVQVLDVNDNAPFFLQTSVNVHVTENNGIGTSIGSVSAFDADCGENASLSYSIIDDLILGFPTINLVTINPVTGVMFAQHSFDYEQFNNFRVIVQAADGGSPSLKSNTTVNVLVNDRNDNAPVIIAPMSTKGSSTKETVPQSADPGYLVTKVTATDADSGQNALLTYQLLQPTDKSLFTIASDTGEIWTVRCFGSKDSLQQKLIILVKDGGDPSLSAIVVVHVSVLKDDKETADTISTGESTGSSIAVLKLHLIIGFGILSSVLFIAIIFLALKIHKCRHGSGRWCCAKMLFETEQSTTSIQIPTNYLEVYETGVLPPSFCYDKYSKANSTMSDFIIPKSATPKIDINDDFDVREGQYIALSCANKKNIKSYQIRDNRQWNLEQSSMERCPSGQSTLAKNEVEREQRRFLEIHSHAL